MMAKPNFSGDESQAKQQGISYSLLDYFELVDRVGPIIKEDKRVAIQPNRSRLVTLSVGSSEDWLRLLVVLANIIMGC